MADYAGSQSSLPNSANPAAIAAGATGEATGVSRDRALIDARNLPHFLRGMAYGVGDGAVGFVDGIKTGVRGVGQYGYFVWVHWTEGAAAAAGTSAGQAIDSATVLAIKYGPEVARIMKEIRLGVLSPETRELIAQVQPLVDDILAAIAEEFDSLSAEEQAELIGRITAATIVEVVAFVGTGGTGAALVIAAKTGKLANITSKLGGFSAKLKNKVSAAIGKFVSKVDDVAPRSGGAAHIFDETFSSNRYFDAGDAARKHGSTARRGTRGRIINEAPINGSEALDNSWRISPNNPNAPRRVGVDIENQQIVVFDRTGNKIVDGEIAGGSFHGHVRNWSELTPEMQRVLRENGISVRNNGQIIWD
jgi:hypothetical protein